MDRYVLTAYALVWVTLALRAAIVGETFERALHRVDPRYRNQRDLLSGVVTDLRGTVRGLPVGYRYFAGRTFRRVDDPDVEQLRKRTTRVYVALGAFMIPGLPLTLLLSDRVSSVASNVTQAVAIALGVAIATYWVRRLVQSRRDSDRSFLIPIYEVAGIVAALGAVVATLAVWAP